MAAHKPRSCLSDAFKAVRARESGAGMSVPKLVPEPSVKKISPPVVAATRSYGSRR